MVSDELKKLWEQSHIGDDVAQTARRMVNSAMRSYGLPVVEPEGTCNKQHLDADDPFYILGVTPDDPWDLVHDVYRAKSKHIHPNNKLTGNAGKFIRLSAALEAVKQLKGVK